MDVLRALIAIAFIGLLVRLRYDADRFEAAESDPGPASATWSGYGLRLAWVLLAIALAGAVGLLWPDGADALGLSAAGGVGGFVLGILVGLVGAGAILAAVWYFGRGLPSPVLELRDAAWATANIASTALVDEIGFRGAALGLFLAAGADPGLAVVGQAILYTLATRLARARGGLVPVSGALLLGLVTGWLAVLTGGLLAPFVAHLVMRSAALTYTADLLPLDTRPG